MTRSIGSKKRSPGAVAAAVHGGHVATQRDHRDDEHDAQQDQLEEAGTGHGQNLSGNTRTSTR